jgi:lysozyme family protein
MIDNFDKFWEEVIVKNEGGGVYHKVDGDTGGGTKWGVSDLSDGVRDGMIDLHRDGTEMVPVKDLTEDQAEYYYKEWYLPGIWFDKLPSGIDLMVADMSVNHGSYKAVQILQRACGSFDDGKMGNNTFGKVMSCNQQTLCQEIASRRGTYFADISAYRTKKMSIEEAIKFNLGWNRRNIRMLVLSIDTIIF